MSRFFDRLGRALIARGHRVHRVNLHLGDRFFWRLPATDFRGRPAEWREFIGALMERHGVTDLVLHGDRRPYHLVAAEEARARGIAVIATDLGYLRPDWLTLEYDGMATYSRLPRDPQRIRDLAAHFSEVRLAPRFHTPFWLIAACDVLYNLGLVFGRPLYPHYRYHSTCHPFLEYLGWLRSRPAKLLTARATAAAKRQLAAAPGSYFLVPLQLQTDFSIRAHSPFRDLRDAARAIIASFAASGSDKRLVFVTHPLDNGLINWHRLIGRWADAAGVGDRVTTLHGGTPIELQRHAAGLVTVNSTVAMTALYLGVPTKVLGNAVFAVAGLTCQAPLESFFHNPAPPDPDLLAAFLRVLVGTTQIQGGYYRRDAQDCAIAGFVERLERRPYPLPPLAAGELAARLPRPINRTIAVTGVADAIGVALARALAAPGIRLCLFGAADVVTRTAADCQQRGALVAPFGTAGDETSLAAALAACDRDAPLDLLVAHAPAAAREEPGLPATMPAFDAVAEAMRRRGSGTIALIGAVATDGEARSARRDGALPVACAGMLRRRLRGAGVAVAVAAPSRLAVRLAVALGDPGIAAVGPDFLAERVVAGLRRGHRAIVVPGAATAVARALRRLWRLAPAALSRDPAGRRAIDAAPPFAGESAPGD